MLATVPRESGSIHDVRYEPDNASVFHRGETGVGILFRLLCHGRHLDGQPRRSSEQILNSRID